VPRDATATRERLILAAAELFAEKGIDAARSRDIVRAAGQANDSAIGYHFGSREGLLEAILDKHIEQEERNRAADLNGLEQAGLDTLVEALVRPTADELLTRDGRRFLRIIDQLSDRAGVRSHRVPGPLRGTALARQLELLEQALDPAMPQEVRRERVAAVIMLLTSTLADRARRIDRRRTLTLGHDAYVANLVAMCVGALRAPHAFGV
jgi:TetR/AcrR family transcriptional regulator, regulator of cefoperazone and chloramphenicol sensitivity